MLVNITYLLKIYPFQQMIFTEPMIKSYSSLAEIKSGLKSDTITVKALVENYLVNIKANCHLNAPNLVFEEEALQNAEAIDQKLKQEQCCEYQDSCAIKDNICYQGHEVTASSKIIEGFKSIYSSNNVSACLMRTPL